MCILADSDAASHSPQTWAMSKKKRFETPYAIGGRMEAMSSWAIAPPIIKRLLLY